jgi:signal transduction histidine kinase
MAALIVALGSFAWVRQRADLNGAVDMGLRSRAQVLTQLLTSGQPLDLDVRGSDLIDPDESFAQVLAADGSILNSSEIVADAPLIQMGSIRPGAEPTFLTQDVAGFDDPVRLLATTADLPDPNMAIVVGTNLGDMNDALQRFAVLLTVVGSAALVVTTIAGWFLAGAALRPVERLRREAAALSVSEPDRRLDVPGTNDELARLAVTLNGLLDRLHQALEQERRFVDDASHELRTPLATLSGEIDLALARPRTPEELVASLRTARDDVDHLERLANDLLVLARSRGGRIPIRRAPTSVRTLLERSVSSVTRQAAAAGVRLEIDASDATIDVDPERVHQALRNLLENAVHYAPRDSTVRVIAEQRDGEIRITVEDSGPGFSPGLIPSAFDPFVRGDTTYDDERDGAGLGLAIVKAVAEAHGGAARARNSEQGAQVTLSLRA